MTNETVEWKNRKYIRPEAPPWLLEQTRPAEKSVYSSVSSNPFSLLSPKTQISPALGWENVQPFARSLAGFSLDECVADLMQQSLLAGSTTNKWLLEQIPRRRWDQPSISFFCDDDDDDERQRAIASFSGCFGQLTGLRSSSSSSQSLRNSHSTPHCTASYLLPLSS